MANVKNVLSSIDDLLDHAFKSRYFCFFALIFVVLLFQFHHGGGQRDGLVNSSSQGDMSKYLCDRPFIDQFPIDPRKTYHIYVFTEQGTGAFITSQNFKQIIELFFYNKSENSIKYRFPNANLEGTTEFKIDDSRGPGTFDIKLSLSRDPKNEQSEKSYYSWKRYKASDNEHDHHNLSDLIARARSQLEGLERAK